jgi:hypothetical protein
MKYCINKVDQEINLYCSGCGVPGTCADNSQIVLYGVSNDQLLCNSCLNKKEVKK